MRLRRLVVIVALLGMLAIFLVYEHSRVTRAGFRISELSRGETRLVEQLRLLNIHVTRLRQPEFIQGQLAKLRIDLMEAPNVEIVPVALEQPEFARTASR